MKKTFYQLHIQAHYIRLICLMFIICGCYLLSVAFIKTNIPMLFISLIPVIISLHAYIIVFNNRIIFLEDKIKVTGNLGKANQKIQFSDNIFYLDIEDVKMIYANKNSKNKKISSSNIGNLQPKLFFEFILKNHETKWLFIGTFSKKQRTKMLEIINSKTGKSFSYATMERKDLSIYNRKKHY